MHDSMIIKSKMRDYRVFFVEDFLEPLKEYAKQDTFFMVDALIFETYGARIKSAVSQDRLLAIEANERSKTTGKCQE